MEDDAVYIEMGRSETARESDADEQPTSVLWVPDPEKPRGWREYYVYRPKPQARPVGFGRRKA